MVGRCVGTSRPRDQPAWADRHEWSVLGDQPLRQSLAATDILFVLEAFCQHLPSATSPRSTRRLTTAQQLPLRVIALAKNLYDYRELIATLGLEECRAPL